MNYFNCKWKFNIRKTIAFMPFMFKFSPAVQIYDISYISLAYLHLLQVHYKLTNCSSPSWVDSSIGRILHRFLKGSWWSPIFFFQALFLKFRLLLLSWIVQQEHLSEQNYKGISFLLSLLHGSSLIALLLRV